MFLARAIRSPYRSQRVMASSQERLCCPGQRDQPAAKHLHCGFHCPSCAGAPAGALVATNIGSISGTNLAIGPAGVAACQAAGLAHCAALQTTFAPPPGLASTSGPVDSYAGTPVDFQFLNGNLVRNAGLSLGLTRFDISLMKAFRIPRWESASVELKMDVFNVFSTSRLSPMTPTTFSTYRHCLR